MVIRLRSRRQFCRSRHLDDVGTGRVSRWLNLHDRLQLTHALFEVGRSALEEIDPAKEAVGRRLLPCRDRREGKGYQRGEYFRDSDDAKRLRTAEQPCPPVA